MRNKKGFTLIELLVVIAIIGLLSTLAVVSLNGARSKARDARRISDVKAIQTAVELYKADHNDNLSNIVTAITVPGNWDEISSLLTDYLFSGLPTDPGDTVYNICAAGDNYVISTTLENNPPSPGIQTVAWDVAADCRDEANAAAVPDCITALTNYCVGSLTKD